MYASFGELGEGRKFKATTNFTMSENDGSETNPIMSAHENNTDKESETRILSRE